MITVYKLTTKDDLSYGGTRWEAGTEHTATGSRLELCTDGVIHAYRHPLLAELFRPIHVAAYSALWEATTPEIVVEDATKCGVKRLKTIKKISLPEINIESRIRWAISAALFVYKEESFVQWAKNWLNGEDRSDGAAHNAAHNAAANYAAHNAAADYAVTYAVAHAVYYAVAHAAHYAAHAAAHAAYAAYAAAYAAAAVNNSKLTWKKLLEFAEWAITNEPLPEKEFGDWRT